MRGHHHVTCHMVFDVKPHFTQKARFVANGAMTKALTSVKHSSMASRDSMQLMFLMVALNDLGIFACNIENACLNALCKKKMWFVSRTEMGEDKGKAMIVVSRALYGLKLLDFA